VTRIRLHTGIKLLINVIKTKIILNFFIEYVTRIRTKIKLSKIYYANMIKIDITNIIKTDILNHYGENKIKVLKNILLKIKANEKITKKLRIKKKSN